MSLYKFRKYVIKRTTDTKKRYFKTIANLQRWVTVGEYEDCPYFKSYRSRYLEVVSSGFPSRGGKVHMCTHIHTWRETVMMQNVQIKSRFKKNLLTFLTNFPNIQLGGKNTR